MPAGAAPATGRRASVGPALFLALFLLAGPRLYFLGPFALLMLAARPRTLWELFCVLAAGAGIAAGFVGDMGLSGELERLSATLLSGAFLLFAFRRGGTGFSRAVPAVLVALLGVILWARMGGIGLAAVQQEFISVVRAAAQSLQNAADANSAQRNEVIGLAQMIVDAAPDAARVLPGMLCLSGLAGACLAWRWHHRLASKPIGPPPPAFRDFRFHDQFIWGAILSLGGLLFPLDPLMHTVAANLLLVFAGLYVTRGLAVFAALLAPAPPTLKLMAGGLAVLIAPVALGAGATLGLADTWLDIRGRLAPPASGGVGS